MDYFLLKQDERYSNTPILTELMKKFDLRYMNRLNAHKIEDINIVYIKADKETNFLDVLDKQLFIVSDRLKRIMEKYDSEIIFKMLALIDTEKERQETYYLPFFEEIEALSPSSEFNLDRSVVKRLVLDSDKIKGKKIFRIKECEKPLVVVRLDAAESILRRDFTGIKLEKLEVEKCDGTSLSNRTLEFEKRIYTITGKKG